MANTTKPQDTLDAFSGAADAGARQASEALSRFKKAAEEASEQFREAYSKGTDGYRSLGLKSVELSRDNLNAHLDFLSALLEAKSPSQAMEIQSKYVNDQLNAYANQAKELTALGKDAAAEATRNVQDAATRLRNAGGPK